MNKRKIDEIFNKNIGDNYFSGGVCCISLNEKKIFHKAYGHLNRDKKTKVTNNTIFDLASVTKVVTTTIILKMITEGALSLRTKLGECLPETSNNSSLSSISIQQLLTHTSGLKAWHAFYSEREKGTFLDILNQINLLKKTDGAVEYSDLNFMFLGEVIKHYYDNSLQNIVQNVLVKPLNLKSLTYNPTQIENIAATEFGNRTEEKMCYDRQFHFNGWRKRDVPIKGQVNDGNAFYFFNGEAGHAGLFSDVKDLITLGELYLKGGNFNDEQILSEMVVDQAFTLHAGNRALGWESSDIYPSGFGHTGFTGTALWIEPKQKVVVGVMTNRLNVEEPKSINSFRRDLFKEISNSI